VCVHVTVCVRRERVCMCMCIYCMCLVGRDFVRGRESKRMCVLSSPSVSSFLHLVPILHTTCPLPLRTPLTFPIPSYPILSHPTFHTTNLPDLPSLHSSPLPFTPFLSLSLASSSPLPFTSLSLHLYLPPLSFSPSSPLPFTPFLPHF
jgi:hypothetical protein